MSPLLYTIGHSNRALKDFIEILKIYNIRTIIDVRRWPSSKKYPYFGKDSLEKVLRDEGIDYYWLGEHLGGYRSPNYIEYMKTEEYRKGISTLLEILAQQQHKGNVAILCSEKYWFKCHRRFIADTLKKHGIKVIHIADKDKTYYHK